MIRPNASRHAILAALWLTSTSQAEPIGCRFDEPPSEPAAVLACAQWSNRPVAGTQQLRYSRASDLRPGRVVAELEELVELDGESLRIRPRSAWGEYRYHLSVLHRQAADREAQPLPKSGPVELETLRWEDLDRLTPTHQARLRGRIEQVDDEGRTLFGHFDFAGETIEARLELEAAREGGPQPAAQWRNIPYGPHWQQTIDLYPADVCAADRPPAERAAAGIDPAEGQALQPPSATEASNASRCPLVIAIHGGGWGALDKDNTFGLQATLPPRGIHVASINYRFIHTAPEQGIEPAVRMPLEDAARAVQMLRWLAAALDIDPNRIGAMGGSAGGFTALWLALHPDMADPSSIDPVARESTRLQAVAGIDAQTSLDPAQMRAWVPTITYGAHAFGIYDDAGRAAAFATWLERRASLLDQIQRYSPYALATAEAPPIHLSYPQRGLAPAPGETGWAAHAPQFGVELHKRLQALGVESYLHHKDRPDPHFGADAAAFLTKVLSRTPPNAPPSAKRKYEAWH
jgi:acetyl esterase/lipase